MPTIANAQAETLLIPDSEAELSELLRHHHAGGLPWTPSGLGTRLHWGAPLQQAGAVVSVRRLNGIVDHAVDDLTITVQAGLPLADLQQLLAEGQALRYYRNSARSASSACLGLAPTTCLTTCPSLYTLRVGMETTPY